MRSTLLLWLVLCGVLASTVLLDPQGAITPDSANYCRLATQIADGHGPTVLTGRDRIWYTTHPAGYPMAIALVQKLTTTSAFWASKIVQMLCILAMLIIADRTLGSYARLIPLLLVSDPCWTLFLYSWSEPLFVLCCLVVVVVAGRLWERPRGVDMVVLTLAACAAVTTRYSAIAIPILLAATSILALMRKRRAWWQFLTATVFASATGVAMAWMNITYGGSATGIRERTSESLTTVAGQIGMAFMRPLVWIPVPDPSLKLPLYAAQALGMIGIFVVVYRFARRQRAERAWVYTPTTMLFVACGVVITVVTVLPRFVVAMDPVGLRFVAPGALLCGFGAVRWWRDNAYRLPSSATMIMITASVLACGTAVRMKSWLVPVAGAHTVLWTHDSVLARYASVPDSSVIAFGSDHILYLRPLIHAEAARTTPWYTAPESMPQFLARMRAHRPVHCYIDTVRDEHTYHKTVQDFVDSLRHPSGITRLW